MTQISPKFKRALESEIRRLMEARGHWISASTARRGLAPALEQALKRGRIRRNDTVWMGPSGDVLIAQDAASVSHKYADYNDEGTVAEFLRRGW